MRRPLQHPRSRRHTAAIAAAAAACAAGAGTLIAASAGSTDPSFAAVGTGLNGPVNALAVQPDGRILVGGEFTAYNDTSRPRIARLTSSGALDTSFNPGAGFDAAVNALALQADGDVLAVGAFSSAGGLARNLAARLDPDGSVDTAFFSGPLTSGVARAIVRVPTGGSIAAGSFSGLVMGLKDDGTGATSGFAPSASLVGGSDVRAVARMDDGRVVIGGAFVDVGGNTAYHGVARILADGSAEDPSFATSGTGLDGAVNAVAVQADGKVVIGGEFTAYNGTSRPRIARLNADGSLDTGFAPGAGFDAPVSTLALQPDGRIVAGGQFTSYNGTSRPRIARLDASGTLDASFAPGGGFDASVNALALQPDGGVVAGGAFTRFAGASAPRVTRLLGAATTQPSPAPAPAPAPTVAPVPSVGRSGVARVVRGTVTIRVPGATDFAPLTPGVLEALPVGSQVDTRRGVVSIRIREGGTAGPTRNVVVSRGVFTFQQNFRRGRPTLTDIRLSQPLACAARTRETALARTRSRTVRVSVQKAKQRRKRGVVRTRSRYVTGTARGTSWSASDTCGYSRVKVFRGVVAARNTLTRRTVVLRAPRAYIARPR
jgi:uncharacterized delta-60 repeat protein